MDKTKPYWYKLLKHFENNHYFQNGLTLPFILGSRSIIEPDEPIQNIYEIIQEFTNYEENINVLMCGCIGEYVFRIGDKEDAKIYNVNENFISPDGIFDNFSNSQDIASMLNTRYFQYINDKKYSRNNGDWVNYSPEEIDRISKV